MPPILVRNLSVFCLLPVVNNATVNILAHGFGCMYVYILLGICLGIKLINPIVCTFLL